MYHDKRFQRDSTFPFLAFNHEQIKGSTTGGFLLTKRHSFDDIANRLLNIDHVVMKDMADRLIREEHVKPETREEKECYQLIHDLDHVGHHVQGSTTNKKYMRKEVWSLISYRGAPTWYITLSPADTRSPLCLYFAETNETFRPELVKSDAAKRNYEITHNPVAAARYFHYMIEMFIKHVLGVGTDHAGLYGDTSAYYGAVEQ
ncbi:hypothetical protein PLICRDRAFT_73777, partial [Plicaturopsis crispa FD-325 SS-3]